MMTFQTGVLGVDQGSVMMFAHFDNDGPMWAGQGPREVRRRVDFPTPFLLPPAVLTAISLFDCDHRKNLRADLRAEEIAAEGFDLVFRSWGDTRIARIRADWTAMGAVRDPESWDV
jgi:hypothetical protein